jgi:hypothetical protein
MQKPTEKQMAKLIQDFKEGKLTRQEMEEKMREYGIEYPSVILSQWEVIQ